MCFCKQGYRGDGKSCDCEVGLKRNGTQFCVDTGEVRNIRKPRILFEYFLPECFRPPCTDECSTEEDSCDDNAECFNTYGSYECNCMEGFFGNGRTCFRGTCSDSTCPSEENQKCSSPTTADCECVEGFKGVLIDWITPLVFVDL